MKIPWGIETIGSVFAPGCHAELPNGKWVIAVAKEYPTNLLERIRGAWWVVTGRAVTFVWPKPGELEIALGWDSPQRQQSVRPVGRANQT